MASSLARASALLRSSIRRSHSAALPCAAPLRSPGSLPPRSTAPLPPARFHSASIRKGSVILSSMLPMHSTIATTRLVSKLPSEANACFEGRYFSSSCCGLVLYMKPSGSVVNHLESANTMFSFVWWIIGLYWVSAGGQTLTHDAPHLYWLSAAFLTFDVFFVLFCVGLAFIIGLAVCCCLPCIIAILYAVADQEGASEEDLHQLPKYKFQTTCDFDNFGEISCTFGGIMIECNTETPNERVLSPEDAECCICLSAYDDGVELRQLPCNHHFHCYCVDKWLYINATCPLCKYHILKNGNHGRQSV